MPIFEVYTDKDRKLTVTSEMHNWSSRHSTNMILNFMEGLLSDIQLSYDPIKVI